MPDDREVLFANEAFAISVLQAVSGGSVIAALAQADAIMDLGGQLAFLVYVSSAAFALVSALLAAYWRHQYKLWDVRGSVSAAKGKDDKAVRRGLAANRYFKLVRFALLLSLLAIVAGLAVLIGFFWYDYLSSAYLVPAECAPEIDTRLPAI